MCLINFAGHDICYIKSSYFTRYQLFVIVIYNFSSVADRKSLEIFDFEKTSQKLKCVVSIKLIFA